MFERLRSPSEVERTEQRFNAFVEAHLLNSIQEGVRTYSEWSLDTHTPIDKVTFAIESGDIDADVAAYSSRQSIRFSSSELGFGANITYVTYVDNSEGDEERFIVFPGDDFRYTDSAHINKLLDNLEQAEAAGLLTQDID